jgi:hypothetical protein
MSSTDHTKAAGKAGQRGRKAPPQAPKADRKPEQAKATKARAAATAASSHVGANGATAPAARSPIAAVAPPVSAAARVAAGPVRTAALSDAAPVSLQTIATAYGDYTKKSLDEVRSFAEKLIGARSLDKAVAIQSEFAQHAFQNLVADTQKIYGLYGELAKQTFKPFGGLLAKVATSAR